MILVIETCSKGGSISICREKEVLGFCKFSVGTSVAIYLIDKLDELLNQLNLDKSQIQKIIVSNGPGSLTGIRIGISTAIGLSVSLGVECVGISLLEAIAFTADSEKVVSIFMPNPKQYYLQKFEEGIKSDVALLTECEFLEVDKILNNWDRIAYKDFEPELRYNGRNSSYAIKEPNLSKYLYLYYYSNQQKGKFCHPQPIYLENKEYKKWVMTR